MFPLEYEPFSASNLMVVLTISSDNRRAAALHHVARQRHLWEAESFDEEYEQAPNPPASVLLQLLPSSETYQLAASSDDLERLRRLTHEHVLVTGQSHARWTQDGVVLQDDRISVRNALTFFPHGGFDLYSRAPFVSIREQWRTSMDELLSLIRGSIALAEAMLGSGSKAPEIFADLSILNATAVPPHVGRIVRGGRRGFDRNHVFIGTEFEGEATARTRAAADFLTRVCQAAGLPRCP